MGYRGYAQYQVGLPEVCVSSTGAGSVLGGVVATGAVGAGGAGSAGPGSGGENASGGGVAPAPDAVFMAVTIVS